MTAMAGQDAQRRWMETRWPDMNAGLIASLWDALTGQAKEAWAAAGQHAELEALREQLSIVTGALRDIQTVYDAGAYGHDIAHTALDRIGGVKPSPPREAVLLREQLADVRDKLQNLAAGLELSAQASSPSKKSEIERGCAAAVRGIAGEIKETTDGS